MASVVQMREQSFQEFPDLDGRHYDSCYTMSIAQQQKPAEVMDFPSIMRNRSSKASNPEWKALLVQDIAKKIKAQAHSDTRDGQDGQALIEESHELDGRAEAWEERYGRLDTIQEDPRHYLNRFRRRSFNGNNRDQAQQQHNLGENICERETGWRTAAGANNNSTKLNGQEEFYSKWSDRGEGGCKWERKLEEELLHDLEEETESYYGVGRCRGDTNGADKGSGSSRKVAQTSFKTRRSGEIGVFGAENYFSTQESKLGEQPFGGGGEEEEEEEEDEEAEEEVGFLEGVPLESHRYSFQSQNSFQSRNSTAASSDISSETWSMLNGSLRPPPEAIWRIHGSANGSANEVDLSAWSSPNFRRAAAEFVGKEASSWKWSSSSHVDGGGAVAENGSLVSVEEEEDGILQVGNLQITRPREKEVVDECASSKLCKIVDEKEGARACSASKQSIRRGATDGVPTKSSIASSSTSERGGRAKKKASKQLAFASKRLASFLARFWPGSEKIQDSKRSSSRSSIPPSSGKGPGSRSDETIYGKLPLKVQKSSCLELALASSTTTAAAVIAQPPPEPQQQKQEIAKAFYSNAEMLPPNGKPASPRARRSFSLTRPSSSLSLSGRNAVAFSPISITNSVKSASSPRQSIDSLESHISTKTWMHEEAHFHSRKIPERFDGTVSAITLQHEREVCGQYAGNGNRNAEDSLKLTATKSLSSNTFKLPFLPRKMKIHLLDRESRESREAKSMSFCREEAQSRSLVETATSFVEPRDRLKGCHVEKVNRERMEEVAGIFEHRERRTGIEDLLSKRVEEMTSVTEHRDVTSRIDETMNRKGMDDAFGQVGIGKDARFEIDHVHYKDWMRSEYHDVSLSQTKSNKEEYYESDSSSDLFEIETFASAGMNFCRKELPVYEAKCISV